MSGIYRPGRGVQRITRNAGNGGFIRGGRIRQVTPHLGPVGKALLLAAILTPDLPDPPAAEPEAAPAPGGFLASIATSVSKLTRGKP